MKLIEPNNQKNNLMLFKGRACVTQNKINREEVFIKDTSKLKNEDQTA